MRDRLPGMMVLALAISVAFFFSAAVTLGYPGMPLWEELATLVTIMLLGHWIEMRSIAQAQGAVTELAKLLPDTAVRIVGENTEEVRVSDLRLGDLLLVRPGAGLPADGVVRQGESAVNESMITGESRPVSKIPGAKVIAGTVNGYGSLRVEVTGTGERTALAGIMRLVAEAQSSRSPRTGTGGSRRFCPDDHCAWGRCDHSPRVAVAAGKSCFCSGAARHGTGGRLSSCLLGARNPAGHCNLNHSCGP